MRFPIKDKEKNIKNVSVLRRLVKKYFCKSSQNIWWIDKREIEIVVFVQAVFVLSCLVMSGIEKPLKDLKPYTESEVMS